MVPAPHGTGVLSSQPELPPSCKALSRPALPCALPAPHSQPRSQQELAAWNARYEARFGHIFIVCATGKSAAEMLAAIQQR